MKQVGSGRPVEIDGVDLDRVRQWLDEQGVGGGDITDVALATGGTQNILVRFRRGRDEFLLRRPPLRKRDGSDKTMVREARVLEALRHTDVPHPGLVAICEDPDVTGAVFYIMEAITGFNPTVVLPGLFATHPPTQHYMGLAMVDGLAALGRVDLERVGLTDLSHSDNWLELQLTRWDAQLVSYADAPGYAPGQLGAVENVRTWLADNVPGRWTPALVHGDYHFANVLFEPARPKLAAIIDWELAAIGDPLLDLGHLLATWPHDGPGAITNRPKAPGLPSKGEIVARYAWKTGRDLSDLTWYCVLACYRLAVLLEGTHARACAGRADRQVGGVMHAMAQKLVLRAGELIRDPSHVVD
jgi:aminoglycoside phosphotransferase (APT) family kinase protein